MSDPSRPDDQVLVARIQRGDGAALDSLIERYHAPLCQFLERMLGDPETAQEVAQEAFLRMMRALPRYRPRARFSTWLYTIASNLARDELRRQRHRADRVTELEEADRGELAEPPLDVVDAALDRIEREDVRRALRSLSEDHRAVVVLHYYEGFSYKEIADIRGCTVGTVGSRLHYAVRHLRRVLAAETEET